MLVEFERERTRLETFPPPQRGAYEVGAALATIRSDIATAGRVIELEQQAAALQSEMDRFYADLTPLRQLVNAMQRYTGVSNSTIANMSRGA